MTSKSPSHSCLRPYDMALYSCSEGLMLCLQYTEYISLPCHQVYDFSHRIRKAQFKTLFNSLSLILHSVLHAHRYVAYSLVNTAFGKEKQGPL